MKGDKPQINHPDERESDMVLFLSKSQVRSLLSMRESIHAVERAFRELALGTAIMPTRVGLTLPEEGWLGVMPAYLEQARSLTTKIVTVYRNNMTKHGIPNVLAAIILNDVETGRIAAIMEGAQITAMRTGAVSGVATRYLARTDATRLGIFGAGVQAWRQFQAVMEVRAIRSVSIFDTRKEMASDFVAQANAESDVKVSVANTPDEVVREADIIVTATTSAIPVFNGRHIKPGAHINAIGSFTPSTREVDSETVATSKIVVDSMDAALAEAGDIIIPLKEGIIQRESVWGELGEIVTGKKPGRTSEAEKTLFKSVGLGIQDAAVASIVFQKASRLGVGTQLDLEN